MGNDTGNVVTKLCQYLVAKINFFILPAPVAGYQWPGFISGSLILIGRIDIAPRRHIHMAAAKLVMAGCKARQNLSGVSVHEYQCGFHGVEIQLDTIIIRMRENTAKGNDQRLSVRVHNQLMRPYTLKFKSFHSFVVLLAVVHRNNAFALLIAAGGYIKIVATG